MQNPHQRSYKCQKHSDQQVMFVCAVNDWHFEPLCQLCTPGHTQNHAKRLKINLESFDQINKKVTGKQSSIIETYQKNIKKINQVQGKYNLEDLPIIRDLRTMEEKIITKIKAYFSEINEKVSSKIKELLNENNQKVKNLAINLENEIKCIQEISRPEIDLYTWKNSAKKIYFEDKLQSYLQESKQIIQEFEEKCVQITTLKKKQIFTDQNKFLTSLITLIGSEVKSLIGQNFVQPEAKGKPIVGNAKKPESKDLVKRPIVKQKSKQCKNCNQEMEYLTENKKHLICRFCNQKERNYTKKAI